MKMNIENKEIRKAWDRALMESLKNPKAFAEFVGTDIYSEKDLFEVLYKGFAMGTRKRNNSRLKNENTRLKKADKRYLDENVDVTAIRIHVFNLKVLKEIGTAYQYAICIDFIFFMGYILGTQSRKQRRKN